MPPGTRSFDRPPFATRLTEFRGPECRIRGLECRIRGLECRIRGLECRIRGLECRIRGLEYRIRGLECRIRGLECCIRGLECRIRGLECRIRGLECRIRRPECRGPVLGITISESFQHRHTTLKAVRDSHPGRPLLVLTPALKCRNTSKIRADAGEAEAA